jgi:hypothetical protein
MTTSQSHDRKKGTHARSTLQIATVHRLCSCRMPCFSPFGCVPSSQFCLPRGWSKACATTVCTHRASPLGEPASHRHYGESKAGLSMDLQGGPSKPFLRRAFGRGVPAGGRVFRAVGVAFNHPPTDAVSVVASSRHRQLRRLEASTTRDLPIHRKLTRH